MLCARPGLPRTSERESQDVVTGADGAKLHHPSPGGAQAYRAIRGLVPIVDEGYPLAGIGQLPAMAGCCRFVQGHLEGLTRFDAQPLARHAQFRLAPGRARSIRVLAA